MSQSLHLTGVQFPPVSISQFRNTHLQILGENAAEQQTRILSLSAECKSRREENEELRQENKILRRELSREKNRNQQITRGSAAATRACERQDSDEVAVIELDPPTRSKIFQSSKRKDPAQEGERMSRGAEPSFATRRQTGATHEPLYIPRSTNKRRESQAMASSAREPLGVLPKDHRSTMKRRWADRSGTDGAYGSSKGIRKETVSRFGYPSSESKGGNREAYKTRQRFGGDWQRKVSSVPRPSATPDKLRRRGRRSAMDANPLGKRY